MTVLELTEISTHSATTGRYSHKLFKALSDGTRREILFLLEDKQRNVGEMVTQFDLTQPTTSRHLSVLRDAGLIVDERQGQKVVYSLNEGALNASMPQLFGLFRGCQASFR